MDLIPKYYNRSLICESALGIISAYQRVSFCDYLLLLWSKSVTTKSTSETSPEMSSLKKRDKIQKKREAGKLKSSFVSTRKRIRTLSLRERYSRPRTNGSQTTKQPSSNSPKGRVRPNAPSNSPNGRVGSSKPFNSPNRRVGSSKSSNSPNGLVGPNEQSNSPVWRVG